MDTLQLQANNEKQMKALYNKGVFIPAILVFANVIGVTVGYFKVEVHPFATIFAISSILLILYYFIASRLFFSYLKKSAMSMVRFYMIHFSIRFIIGGIIIGAGTYMLTNNSKAYLLGFCALFIVMLLCESLVLIKLEKQLNKNQNEK